MNLLRQRGRPAERALIISRDHVQAWEQRLALHLRECGVQTEVRPEAAYAHMMDHPETTVVPSATLDSIVAWLRLPEATVGRRPFSHHARPGILTTSGLVPIRSVREEALSFGDGDRLFGILTEGDEPTDRRTGVIFLNAGANHRVGPNRLYVSMARDLAARGHPAFRFDVGGIGDGGAAPGMTENEVYSKHSVADVRAAMTFLTRVRAVERFVLVGICSGGFLAFHTSAEDPRVTGQIIINPQTFEWKRGDPLAPSRKRGYKSTRYYLQALWRPSVWRLALRGQLDVRGVASALRKRSAAKATARWRDLVARWRGHPEACNEVERVFRAVSERGVKTLLVFSSNDGGIDMLEEHLGKGASRMRGHANLRLEIVEGADHTFTQSDAQEGLNALITRFVEATAAGTDRALGPLMGPVAKGESEDRDQIMKLLSDDEVARVSTAEGEARLADGDEYIDLAAPNNGVRRVHRAMQTTMGKVLPRSAVSPETWARLAERFGRRFAPT